MIQLDSTSVVLLTQLLGSNLYVFHSSYLIIAESTSHCWVQFGTIILGALIMELYCISFLHWTVFLG